MAYRANYSGFSYSCYRRERERSILLLEILHTYILFPKDWIYFSKKSWPSSRSGLVLIPYNAFILSATTFISYARWWNLWSPKDSKRSTTYDLSKNIFTEEGTALVNRQVEVLSKWISSKFFLCFWGKIVYGNMTIRTNCYESLLNLSL